ncbi:MAG TPA: 1-(5-phosphoribosyl)-5-[(5-phosphoribosylamino)methylideneamino] imidazole-4-carboxamide isomerase [Steroidobacteraceae bacterium]|jgi:phosphoribosylformimino-5-aminoimidazole carboxamide ribotide isomerase|nr:1-(5-phosphoribosyl)-5-[(5-phosphoribosylamino)methylideneamino] imidazole-4-carboxamide isomerase [Steroidobacteraceae bacterium]
MQLIPAIDLKAGRCVRLLRGDFEAETRYPHDPGALLAKYRAFGAQWLHIVDLDGARDVAPDNRPIIMDLAAQKSVNLQVGGGLRNTAALAQVFDAGVARAVIGSAALTQVEQVQSWLEHFGRQRLTLAFDVSVDQDGVPRVRSHGWQRQSQQSLWDALHKYAAAPPRHVLCTDIDRDGTLSGPNIELYREAVRRYPRIEWQASGGIRSAEDLRALTEAGAAAAISGKALLENLIPIEELPAFLPNA